MIDLNLYNDVILELNLLGFNQESKAIPLNNNKILKKYYHKNLGRIYVYMYINKKKCEIHVYTDKMFGLIIPERKTLDDDMKHCGYKHHMSYEKVYQ